MTAQRKARQRGSAGPATLLAGAVLLLALPSTVLAFSTRFDVPAAALPGNGGFGPGHVDAPLARVIAARPAEDRAGHGGLFRFTPAGTATRPDRSITVAVRVDPATARAITVRGVLPSGGDSHAGVAPVGVAEVRISPTAFNLGVARGTQGFTSPVTLPTDIRKIDMPDLSSFKPGTTVHGSDPQFLARLALAANEKTGRAPRTLEGSGDQTVDLGGSYRLSHNLDVTAGVRLQQERDRIAPLPDGKQDGQAVYVGTQFRF
ncbi:MAG: hypothetical protein JF593_06525 [Novosphingobium sp.]|nr:hypothetical protein [Novosphingobium sp.]